MGQIQGIVLPDNIGTALGGTPEEAAKIFLKAASQGLAQVMADAIAQAVGESVGDGGAPPDWTKLVKGCAVKLDWETPPNTFVQTAIAFAGKDAPALGGVSVGISISANF